MKILSLLLLFASCTTPDYAQKYERFCSGPNRELIVDETGVLVVKRGYETGLYHGPGELAGDGYVD